LRLPRHPSWSPSLGIASVAAVASIILTGAPALRAVRAPRRAAIGGWKAAIDTGAVVQGTITRADFHSPVEGARVELVDRERTAFTGKDGRYRFADVKPGRITIEVDFLGSAPVQRWTTLRPGETLTADIEVPVKPIPQEELRATVRGTPGALERFERRVAAGRGQLVTERDIERYHGELGTLLATRNVYGPGTKMRRPLGKYCEPQYFVNGRRADWLRNRAQTVTGRPADYYPKYDVTAVEIYPPDQLPPELTTEVSMRCGAIVLWLKSYTGAPPG